MYMHACMCMYAHVRVCICAFIYVCVCMYVPIYQYTYICIYPSIQPPIYLYTCILGSPLLPFHTPSDTQMLTNSPPPLMWRLIPFLLLNLSYIPFFWPCFHPLLISFCSSSLPSLLSPSPLPSLPSPPFCFYPLCPCSLSLSFRLLSRHSLYRLPLIYLFQSWAIAWSPPFVPMIAYV
jgi:hypothetical protein